ncbi:MAG: hypothetical protein A2Y33_08685 [Spirochaetes bacterium GWF1_51_8]|nr:MAG: hypothetical protein A2Y33_08685 [Spirochaetes bacterium GWF1_51_8]
MKTVLKISLIVLGTAVLLILGLIGYMYLPIGVRFAALPTSHVTGDIYALNGGFVNAYLIDAGDEYIMIDSLASVSNLSTALAALSVAPSEVKYVLLTHSDGDHIGGLPLLSDAVIYMSPDEKVMIDGTKSKFFLLAPKKLDNFNFTPISDNETVTLGDKSIYAVSVPGHTPGSQSYLIDGKYLFVGDALNLNNNKAEEFFLKYTMDMPTLTKSISKLASLNGVEAIFTAHTGITTNTAGVFENYTAAPAK